MAVTSTALSNRKRVETMKRILAAFGVTVLVAACGVDAGLATEAENLDNTDGLAGELKKCPSPADPTVHYVSQSPSFCMRAKFACQANQKAFSNACGCGCIDQKPACPSPTDPTVHYVSQDPSFCARAKFACQPDQKAFTDACGCGCIDQPKPKPACPSATDPKVRYVSQDPSFCARAFFACKTGETLFSNSCGCGCLLP